MDRPDRDQFWDHVETQSDGSFKCNFCSHPFAAGTSITRIKWHLSGEKGRGVKICERMPQDVREAASLVSGDANKRRKTMVGSSNINEATNTASTYAQEQINDHADLTLSDVERMLLEDSSTEQEVGKRNVSCAEAANHMENRPGENSRPLQRSITPERLPIDENDTSRAAIPAADLMGLVANKNWGEILASTSSGALQPLSRKLMSPKFASMEKEYSELKEWKRRLLLIHAVLDDAEKKQLINQAVRIWLSTLRDLAYDAEDIVDEFETDTLLVELRNVESQAGTSTAQMYAIPNTEIQSRLKEITARLDEIIKEKNFLDLDTNAGGSYKRVYDRDPTTSLVKEPKIYGRENDKEAIMKLLMSGGGRGDFPYSVIPITGMGGVGKTTLAQLIFNDQTLQFDYRAWVCVSDQYDILKITMMILKLSGSGGEDNLDLLQLKLKEKLSGKKFLIVLDDVWEKKYEKWTNLCGPFAAGAPGSIIIVTSRSEDVLSKRHSVAAYKLGGLPNDECLCLFAQHALDQENFDTHPDLKAVGEKIVKRCKGLPLAAKTLGGLLYSKESVQEWEEILNSKIWDLPEEESDILPALRLSYYHLPSRLKQCFSYCAIFPKDYEFEKEEMVLLWMAEGFLQQPVINKQGQELGHAYFEELLSRSFFQECSSSSNSNNNKKSRYVMHDLMSDLAQFVGGDMWFQLDDNARVAESCAKVRHSTFIPHFCNTRQRFEVFDKMRSLRTFISLLPPLSGPHSYFFLSSKVLDELVPKLKCLRSLSLARYRSLEKLPNSIHALKHLRYLNLSFTSIKRLPESLGELLNLQTLKLCDCREIVELPPCIGNLINLECLDVRGTFRLRKMPPEISKLKNLVTLPKFIVGYCSGLAIGELKKLPNLRGQLHIYGLHNVADIHEAKLAKLKEKQGLDELDLEWSRDFHDARNESDEYQVLNLLQPYQSLRKLSVTFYGGTAFSSWVGDPIFTKLVDVELRGCRRITLLPSLGKLPALRNLRLEDMDEVKEVAAEGFPSLETLRISSMKGWEQWSWSNDLNEKFPKLHTLKILSCPQLADLPAALPSLCELEVGIRQEVISKRVHHFTSLKKLTINGILGPASLNEGFVQALDAVEDLVIECCNKLTCLCTDENALGKLANLKRLCVQRCKGLLSLVEGEEGRLPCNLQRLFVCDCDNLKKLPNGLCSLTSLYSMTIIKCPRLVSFPEAAGLPCSLKTLQIEDCESLESLPHGMITPTMNANKNQHCLLEEIVICNCPSLKYFPRGRGGRLPATLKRWQTWGCDKLEFPEVVFQVDDAHGGVSHHCPPHLDNLSIYNFSRTSFPTGFEFPTSLKTLEIRNCFMLKSLPSPSPHSLSHLTELSINGCDELESFPEKGLPLPNLIRFYIWNCTKLKCLPNHMENLTSLQDLNIRLCSSLKFSPEWDFPPNLISLAIKGCDKLTQQLMSREWGLHALTSLKELEIGFNQRGGGGMDYCFPDEDGLLLPTSLTVLRIRDHGNLKSISRGIQHLTSLKEIWIIDCPNLKSLPEEGFSPTLGSLLILNCPLLREGCLKEKGDYWPIIAHIPSVSFL